MSLSLNPSRCQGFNQGSIKMKVDRIRTPALAVLKCHVVDFWNNISLPGFKYLGEPGRHRSDRYIWIVVLLLSLMVSSEYIADAYKKWQGSPVLLSFNDSLTPIALVPFPAVSFCPARRLSSLARLPEVLDTCTNSTDCGDYETNVLSAARLLCPKSQQFNASELNERYYNGSLENYLEEVSVSCDEVIAWFKFSKDDYFEVGGNRSTCSRYFQTLYGDGSSVCFTFNMLPATDLFQDNVVPPVIDNTDFPMKAGWTPDSMLLSADSEKTVPRYVESNGRWVGLFMGIDNHTTNTSDLCGVPPQFNSKMFFHNPAEIPMYQSHESINVPLHKELFLRMEPKVVTASRDLEEYTPENRRCYFSHERPLSLFKVYTQKNCQLECRVNCSASLCDCVPFYLPRINSSIRMCGKEHRTSCSPFLITGIIEGRLTWYDIVYQFRNDTGERVQEQFREFESKFSAGKKLTEKVLNTTYPACACDCPAACTSLSYDVRVEVGEPLHPAITSKEFTRFAVSFKELEFSSILRKELIGLTDFIANSGGVLGVFTGFSFLALCELIYYLTLRLWTTIKHTWHVGLLKSSQRALRHGHLKCCFCCGPIVDD